MIKLLSILGMFMGVSSAFSLSQGEDGAQQYFQLVAVNNSKEILSFVSVNGLAGSHCDPMQDKIMLPGHVAVLKEGFDTGNGVLLCDYKFLSSNNKIITLVVLNPTFRDYKTRTFGFFDNMTSVSQADKPMQNSNIAPLNLIDVSDVVYYTGS